MRLAAAGALALIATGSLSSASAFDESGYFKSGAEINLSIERHQQQLQSRSTQIKTTMQVQRLKLTAYESASRWLQGGLHIGYLNTPHDDAVLASGTLPSGQFLGIQLRKPQSAGNRYNLHWLLAYSYNRLKDVQPAIRTNVAWHDINAELGVVMRLSLLQLSLGRYYAALEGTEQRSTELNSSITNSSQPFSNLNSGGNYLALGYKITKKGRIELLARSGAQRGAALFFIQQF